MLISRYEARRRSTCRGPYFTLPKRRHAQASGGEKSRACHRAAAFTLWWESIGSDPKGAPPEISKDILEVSQSQLHGQDERNEITYAHSSPWRRQMPTWTLRDGPDEVLEEWRSKLKLLWQHIEIDKPILATKSSLAWLLSLHDRTALHAAILAWQPLEERELGLGGARNGQRRLGSANSCYIDEDCPAGYYGQNNGGDWYSDAGSNGDSNKGYDGYCDGSCDDCDYVWGVDGEDCACDSECDTCTGCTQ